MFELQKLLWDVRADAGLARSFQQDPGAVLDAYGITGVEREAMRNRDFKILYERGANPYLLYFYALQIGVDRADYYAQIRGEVGR